MTVPIKPITNGDAVDCVRPSYRDRLEPLDVESCLVFAVRCPAPVRGVADEADETAPADERLVSVRMDDAAFDEGALADRVTLADVVAFELLATDGSGDVGCSAFSNTATPQSGFGHFAFRPRYFGSTRKRNPQLWHRQVGFGESMLLMGVLIQTNNTFATGFQKA
jgi:hypothetical protein